VSEQQYVAGFLFRADASEVALIGKIKPAWQRGKFNGIGGKIEAGETPWDAMCREFREETGANVSTWRQFAVLRWRGGSVYFFEARGSYQLFTTTAEPVVWVKIAALQELEIIPNLRWLIPLALDKDRVSVVAEDLS
jgi:8-oxo-dGTP diphosphatase